MQNELVKTKQALIRLEAQLQQRKEIYLTAATKLHNAEQAVRIVEAKYQPKLKDIALATDKQGETDIIDLITQFRVMVGQNKDHTPVQIDIEARFLQNNYGDLSADDVYMAINLFLNNKLDIDIPSYVVFSPLLIANILNSYKRYAAATIMQVNAHSERDLLLIEKPAPGQRLQGIKDCISECYAHWLTNFEERFYNNLVYGILKSLGKIKKNTNVEEGKQYAERKYSEDVNKIREQRRKQSKTKEAQPLGSFLKKTPAEIYTDPKKAKNVYYIEYRLSEFFKSVDIKQLVDSITESDLLKLKNNNAAKG